MVNLEYREGQWYEVAGDTQKPVDIDAVVKRVEEWNVTPDLRIHELRNGEMVVIFTQIVTGNMHIGDRWEQYPCMTCVRNIYAPHKWWQCWKWRKLVGYEMRYCKE